MTFRRAFRRFLPCLALLLLVPGALAAEVWTKTKTTWKHANGLSITFPWEFIAQAYPSGILQVNGKSGFVGYLVQGTKTDKELAAWWDGERQSYEAEHLKLSDLKTSKLAGGVVMTVAEAERESEQGIPFVVLSMALQRGKSALCLHQFYPKQREKSWTPIFTQVVQSVR